MLIEMRPSVSDEITRQFIGLLEARGVNAQVLRRAGATPLIRIDGGITKKEEEWLRARSEVAQLRNTDQPYVLASRSFQPHCSVLDIGGIRIGGDNEFVIMAGPCSIESEQQINRIARAVRKAGADILRGGAFKPRSSPYDFQGLGWKV